MFIPLLHPLFIFSLVAYAIVRMNRWGWLELPDFLNHYLADLVCMPIILTFCLIGVRWVKRLPLFRLSWGMILSMTLFYALLFEGLLPLKSNHHTGDFIDVIMYFLGALMYGWLVPISNRQSARAT
jgi:hypothetical protein